MAFKNEDLAIHLSEQFEQDVWGAYAVAVGLVHEATKESKKEFQREYITRPGKREANNANCRVYHATHREERNAKSKKWREENKDRMRELKQKWREANKERVRQQDREYQAKKRAERLAATQQLSTEAP